MKWRLKRSLRCFGALPSQACTVDMSQNKRFYLFLGVFIKLGLGLSFKGREKKCRNRRSFGRLSSWGLEGVVAAIGCRVGNRNRACWIWRRVVFGSRSPFLRQLCLGGFSWRTVLLALDFGSELRSLPSYDLNIDIGSIEVKRIMI